MNITNFTEIDSVISEQGIINIIRKYDNDMKKIKKINKIFQILEKKIRHMKQDRDININHFLLEDLFKKLNLEDNKGRNYTLGRFLKLLKEKVIKEGVDKIYIFFEYEKYNADNELIDIDDCGDIDEIHYNADDMDNYDYNFNKSKLMILLIHYLKMI